MNARDFLILTSTLSFTFLTASCSDNTGSSSGAPASPPATSPPPSTSPPPPPPPPVTVSCPDQTTSITVGGEDRCALSGTITTDLTLTNDFIYAIDGPVQVGEPTEFDLTGGTPVTLNIEPGVTLYNIGASLASLHITRGSRIEAVGTLEEPIEFTSLSAIGSGSLTDAAFAGGVLNDPNYSAGVMLIIDGAAPINDGDPVGDTGDFFEVDGFGGAIANHNSGTLRFVRLLYPANDLFLDRAAEHGLALRGVGSGTTIEYLHIHNPVSGGVRFAGGTADLKYYVFTDGDRSLNGVQFTSEALSWRDGWTGRAQFGLVLYNAARSSTTGGLSGNSASGGGVGLEQSDAPISRPQISNFTVIGGDITPSGEGLSLRAGSQIELYNSIFADFSDEIFRIAENSADFFENGGLIFNSTLLDSALSDDDNTFSNVIEVTGLTPQAAQDAFLATGANNAVDEVTVTNRAFVNGFAEAAIPAFDVSVLSDADFTFETVEFIGAVNTSTVDSVAPPHTQNWTAGWTFDCLLDCQP